MSPLFSYSYEKRYAQVAEKRRSAGFCYQLPATSYLPATAVLVTFLPCWTPGPYFRSRKKLISCSSRLQHRHPQQFPAAGLTRLDQLLMPLLTTPASSTTREASTLQAAAAAADCHHSSCSISSSPPSPARRRSSPPSRRISSPTTITSDKGKIVTTITSDKGKIVTTITSDKGKIVTTITSEEIVTTITSDKGKIRRAGVENTNLTWVAVYGVYTRINVSLNCIYGAGEINVPYIWDYMGEEPRAVRAVLLRVQPSGNRTLLYCTYAGCSLLTVVSL